MKWGFLVVIGIIFILAVSGCTQSQDTIPENEKQEIDLFEFGEDNLEFITANFLNIGNTIIDICDLSSDYVGVQFRLKNFPKDTTCYFDSEEEYYSKCFIECFVMYNGQRYDFTEHWREYYLENRIVPDSGLMGFSIGGTGDNLKLDLSRNHEITLCCGDICKTKTIEAYC